MHLWVKELPETRTPSLEPEHSSRGYKEEQPGGPEPALHKPGVRRAPLRHRAPGLRELRNSYAEAHLLSVAT